MRSRCATVKRLVIVGAGGHGRAIAEIVLLLQVHELTGFLDDSATGEVMCGVKVIGLAESLVAHAERADEFIVAIGNNRLREALCARAEAAGLALATIVHPRATVAPSARVGSGSAIMAGSVVGTEAFLGKAVIINSGAVVDHHCVVEDFGHVGAGATMAGGSSLGRRAWMQAGASLGYRVSVANDDVLNPGESRST